MLKVKLGFALALCLGLSACYVYPTDVGLNSTIVAPLPAVNYYTPNYYTPDYYYVAPYRRYGWNRGYHSGVVTPPNHYYHRYR